MKRIVIVGGGFAGVRLARKLRKQKDLAVTLINSSPEFKYCPALYRAATGNKMGIARLPLEWMLLDVSNVELVIGTAVKLDPKKKLIKLADGSSYEYDKIVFALGSITTYFNIEGLHEHSYGIKTAEEVVALRKHLHDKFISRSAEETNYVIVGGGATGVEVAAALGSYVKHIARLHKHRSHKVSIWLVEAAPRLLPLMPEKLSNRVLVRLLKSGVKVQTGTTVKAETIHNLKTSAGTIKTHTVIWTAGVATNPFYAAQGKIFNYDKKGRVIVNKHLEAAPDIYVMGDNASTKYSGLALVAVWHGNFVAKDILALKHHQPRPVYYDRVPAQVVPVGNNWAVLNYGPFKLTGWLMSLVRRAADFLGYSDVLGFFRALTIWQYSDKTEDACAVCHTNRRA